MKTLFLLFVMVVCAGAMAQYKPNKMDDPLYYSPENVLKQSEQAFDTTQVNHIVTCLDHYRKERTIGYCFAIAGTALAVASSQIENESTQQAVVVGSCVSGLASAIVFIRAERWINRKKLIFTGNGVSLRF